MRSRRVAVAGGLMAIAIGGAIVLAPRKVAPPQLAEPAYLPEAARTALHARMQRHGDAMQKLMSQMVVLDYPGAEASAKRIADEAPLARPLSGDASELNALLPKQFFRLQDELKQQAAAVQTAAAARDLARLADAHAGLAQTCMRCHAVYLDEPR
jgi:hypothetical protein